MCRALGLCQDEGVLDMQAGLIRVSARGERWTLRAPQATWRELEEPRERLARALGLDVAEIGERPLWVKAGKEQLIVPLRSADAVRRAAPRAEEFARIQSEDGIGMAYVFALDGQGGALSRFFFPQGSAMLEDPATGSATANFGGWCIAMNRHPLTLQISQGEQIRRPSTLYLDVRTGGDILVGGDVVELGRGVIELG